MKRQRGVALIVAVLVLALAVMLIATLLAHGENTQARVRDRWRAEQSWQLLRGLEAWATEGLIADAQATGGVDSLDEAWARPIAPIEIPGAKISGRLRDLGGCFNLNSLAPGGVADAAAGLRFARLLSALQLPTGLAAEASDYIDGDAEPQGGGAEDAAYAGQSPSQRAANAALADPSEILRLPSMTPERWQVLDPYVCALPVDQKINLNTAPAVLWTTLDERINLPMARRLARDQGGGAYPDLPAVQEALRREGLPPIDLTAYDVGSRYFRAEADILADGIPFAYTSLLERLPGRVRVIARARGGR